MRRDGPDALKAYEKYAGAPGIRPPEPAPALQWEGVIYEWYLRLQSQVITRTDLVPAGMSAAPVQVPYALDRRVWWPLIEREGWHHGVVMTLLEQIDHALYGKLKQDEEADGE